MTFHRLSPVFAAVSILAASCCGKASIDGTAEGFPDSQVVVKQLAGKTATVLDTVKTDGEGRYSYTLEVDEGKPRFIYIYKDSLRLASLIVSKGEKIRLVSDGKGVSTVEGSPESSKLQQVDRDFAAFLGRFQKAAASEDATSASKEYVSYYRSRMSFVMENSKSLAVIPVLYQKVNEDFPVFSQLTDAILFKTVYDSLMTVYPESQYVAALAEEVKRKSNAMSIDLRMREAQVLSFPDLDLPSIDGKKVRLSEVDAKVVMVYFWLASDNAQKMYNNDVLVPLYNEYHSKGFEVYAVCLDSDKSVWASAVKDQKLPWVNLCDGLGGGSPAVSLYNLSTKLPQAFFIVGGQLLDIPVSTEADLRKALRDNL